MIQMQKGDFGVCGLQISQEEREQLFTEYTAYLKEKADRRKAAEDGEEGSADKHKVWLLTHCSALQLAMGRFLSSELTTWESTCDLENLSRSCISMQRNFFFNLSTYDA